MNILGLITARGGSKTIPKKNIALTCGRPLISYTCEAALGSRRLSRVVLSTDDEEIADVGRTCGVEVPFMRPAEIAGDRSPSIDVATHAVEWLAANDAWRADVVVVLQPTSPLRVSRHIDEAVDLLETSGADTVVSVVEVPHRFSPYSIVKLEEGRLRDFWTGPVPFDRFRRQDMPKLYARNGPVVLAVRVPMMLERRGFYGLTVVPYLMDEADSIDIDTPYDLSMAEAALTLRESLRESKEDRA